MKKQDEKDETEILSANSEWKEKVLSWLAGVGCLTALFVNSTPFEVKVTLSESSKEVRHLA